ERQLAVGIGRHRRTWGGGVAREELAFQIEGQPLLPQCSRDPRAQVIARYLVGLPDRERGIPDWLTFEINNLPGDWHVVLNKSNRQIVAFSARFQIDPAGPTLRRGGNDFCTPSFLELRVGNNERDRARRGGGSRRLGRGGWPQRGPARVGEVPLRAGSRLATRPNAAPAVFG